MLIYPVSYVNLPEDRFIANKLPKKIELELRGDGFNLLRIKLRNRQIINVDVQDAKRINSFLSYFPVNNQLSKFTDQLKGSAVVMSIRPDTLFFRFSEKIEKIVPVKIKSSITYAKQHQLKDSMVVFPETVRISGAQEVVNKIQFIETELIKYENLNAAINKKVNLNSQTAFGKVDLEVAVVSVNIPVTRYTEKSFELPIYVENLPDSLRVKTFPEKVNVKLVVAYEDYDNIDISLLRASVDFSQSTGNGTLLKVELSAPDYVKSGKISPERVEYIIRK